METSRLSTVAERVACTNRYHQFFKWESDNPNTPVVAGLSQSPDFSIDAFMREVESREQGASASAKAIDGPELRRLVQVCRSPAACGLHRKTRQQRRAAARDSPAAQNRPASFRPATPHLSRHLTGISGGGRRSGATRSTPGERNRRRRRRPPAPGRG